MKKLVIFSALLLCISCISFYPHPEGGFRPKKPNFTLSKEEFKFNNKIDTTAVYSNLDTLKYDIYKTVFYLKFHNNGRFFKFSKNTKDIINKSNLKPGNIGYYNINHQLITIEYFSIDPYNKHNTEYVKQSGIFKNDTIFIRKKY
ncbi:hypothetical protein [Lacinutrix salivirga]